MLRFQFVNCAEGPRSFLYTRPKLKFSRFGSWSDVVARQMNSVTAEHFHRGERLIFVFPWQVWWLCLSCSGRRWHLTGVWRRRLLRTPKEGMSRRRQKLCCSQSRAPLKSPRLWWCWHLPTEGTLWWVQTWDTPNHPWGLRQVPSPCCTSVSASVKGGD